MILVLVCYSFTWRKGHIITDLQLLFTALTVLRRQQTKKQRSPALSLRTALREECVKSSQDLRAVCGARATNPRLTYHVRRSLQTHVSHSMVKHMSGNLK